MLQFEWNLDNYMEQRQLSITEVAKTTNIHRNVISRIRLNQQTRVDLDILKRLCVGLDCTPNDLFRLKYKNNTTKKD